MATFALHTLQVASAQWVELPAPRNSFNHAPALLAFSDESLLVCWYTGSSERNRDASIICSRSNDGGLIWRKPKVAVAPGEKADSAEAPNKSVGNVTLVRFEGRTALIYGVIQSRKVFGFELCSNWKCGRTDIKISDNDGASWASGIRLISDAGYLPRSRPVSMSDGSIAVPVYHEADKSAVFTFRVDRKTNQTSTTPLKAIPGPSGLIQPSLAQSKSGMLFAYMRDQKRRFVYRSIWNQNTNSWTRAQATKIPNPGAAIDALTQPDGTILLIHNGALNRNSMLVSFSIDGSNFQKSCTLVESGMLGEVSYPSASLDQSGNLMIAFSMYRKSKIGFMKFDRAWLERCDDTTN